MQRYAHAATVDVEGDEYEVGINSVTIYVMPVFDDGLYGYTLSFTDGLPTEDPDECHALNVEFCDADPGEKNQAWHLSRDAGVKVDEDHAIIVGDTKGQGMGKKVETQIPLDAVEFEWGPSAAASWIRKKHTWEDDYNFKPQDQDPDAELLFDTLDPELQQEASTLSDEEQILKIFEEFTEIRDDFNFIRDVEIESDDPEVPERAIIEVDVLLFYTGRQTTAIHKPDPNNFEITDDPYDLKSRWDTMAMPGAFEGHSSFDGTPVLCYMDGDMIVVLG